MGFNSGFKGLNTRHKIVIIKLKASYLPPR